MLRNFTALTTLAILAACGTPNPPTVSAGDVQRSFDTARDLSTRPFTDTVDLPTGSVSYTGEIGVDVSGDLDGSLQGDMTMHVAFAGAGTGGITGDITDINLVDPDGRPNQRLDGALEISGFESNGRVDAAAEGDLTAIAQNGLPQTSDVLLFLDGDVVDNRGFGDGVFGRASGDGIDEDTGERTFIADGVFFGTSD